MMDDLDPRRDRLGEAPPPGTNDDASYAIPVMIIAAILIVGGYFVVSYNGDTIRTAANNPASQSAPAPTPPSQMR